MNWKLRLALPSDIPVLEELIPLSVRSLQAAYYSSEQIEAALGTIFAVDRQLILDGTYFVVEQEEKIIGCGGWSQRKSLFGGDQTRTKEDSILNPQHDPARIRAFFVYPAWTRRGIGRSILAACEKAIEEAHFHEINLVATLAGEPLYTSFGYTVMQRYEIPMSDGLSLPVIQMTKHLPR